VATTGSDSNTGLSPGVALLTIQKAIEIIVETLSIDAGVTVTIQVANGSYTIASTINLYGYVGAGSVEIIGNIGTPGSAILTTSAVSEFFVSTDKSKPYFISGFRIQATAGSPTALVANGGYIQTGNLEFNTGLGVHFYAQNGGQIDVQNDYAVLAASTNHIVADTHGAINIPNSYTITVSGTPGFNAFAVSRTLGRLSVVATITGSATGKRYFAETNSVIDTQGSGSNYFPGNVAGSTSTGGQYV
jgi:hypothetical protein